MPVTSVDIDLGLRVPALIGLAVVSLRGLYSLAFVLPAAVFASRRQQRYRCTGVPSGCVGSSLCPQPHLPPCAPSDAPCAAGSGSVPDGADLAATTTVVCQGSSALPQLMAALQAGGEQAQLWVAAVMVNDCEGSSQLFTGLTDAVVNMQPAEALR